MIIRNIIDSLRESGINTIASSSSKLNDNRGPTNAILYPAPDFFETDTSSTQQWWMADFSSTVRIESYSVYSNSGCYWLNAWSAFSSLNNKTWTHIHSVTATVSGDINYTLETPTTARYFRIDGLSIGCDIPFRFGFVSVKFFGRINVPRIRANKCTDRPLRNSIILFSLVIFFCS